MRIFFLGNFLADGFGTPELWFDKRLILGVTQLRSMVFFHAKKVA